MNRVKKHTRIRTTQRGAKTGGIVTQEAPIHVSNVMVVDSDGKPTRVGYRIDDERPEGPHRAHAPVRTCDDRDRRDQTMPRLKERYRDEIAAALREQFSYGNPMQVPRPGQDRRQHGRRRGRPRRQADRRRGRAT